MCSYTIESRDRIINDFLSLSRHLLIPLLFHELTSLHPPSFQENDFCTCSTYFSFIWGKAPVKMECSRQMTSSMHFGGCLVSFADNATIVLYAKANSTSTYIQCIIGKQPTCVAIHAYNLC